MMPGWRVVLDTNVLVSGVIKQSGTRGAVVDALRDGRFLHLDSPATLEELVDVPARPWLERGTAFGATTWKRS